MLSISFPYFRYQAALPVPPATSNLTDPRHHLQELSRQRKCKAAFYTILEHNQLLVVGRTHWKPKCFCCNVRVVGLQVNDATSSLD